MGLVLAAIAVLLVTGAAAVIASRWPKAALRIGAAGAVAAAALALNPALHALRGQEGASLAFPWAVPGGELALGLDPLSGFFLVPLLVLGAVCAIYGASYLRSYQGRRPLGPPACFFNLTLASMLLVLVARHALLFLVAWEVMTLASYLLITFDDADADIRRAGWVFLIAGHVGVAFLVALFLTLGRHAGGLSFAAFAAQPPLTGALGVLVFVLALLGFGVKAGLVPLHVWLPEAHAAAPSHVSALMSGILIKLGVYGILRTLSLIALAPWRGPILVGLGLGGGLLGISLALYQRDAKRTLAYSSIENVGVILLGLGIGFTGLSAGHAGVATLGIFGALLHLWNHVAMKGLLFLSAGSILHAVGGKDLERQGGLLRRMPWTGLAMIVGAVAIAGLPPLAGFASEWLMYVGLLEGGIGANSGTGLLAFLAAAGLATIGALAALCFVRLIGIALLGQPRSQAASDAHESGIGLVMPIFFLVLAMIAMAFGARALVPVIGPVATGIAGHPLDPGIASVRLGSITGLNVGLLVGIAATAGTLVVLVRRRRNRTRAIGDAIATWDCGYAAPNARMQYTARSFAELAGEHLLPPALRLHVLVRKPVSLFPTIGSFSSDTTDPVTRAGYEPFVDRWARRFARLRWLQQGALHAYLLYILVVVILALVWASARRWWWNP
jgi:formate hydrogenlyase subunit 3/multisubunit Na+/H+ antiporter MnhD subunit